MRIIIMIFLICICSSFAGEKVKVAISDFSPFVMIEKNKKPQGKSIDLWNNISDELGFETEYCIYKTVTEKLNAIKSGEVDVAIGGITATSEREKEFDFSHPTFETSLGIMMYTNGKESYWEGFKEIIFGRRGKYIRYFFFLAIIMGHLMWFLERGKDNFDDRYTYGVPQGIYWYFVTASTVGYGDFTPAKIGGKILTVAAICISLPLFGLFIADAATLNLQAVQDEIKTVDDLASKRVAVVNGTTSHKWANDLDSKITTYNSFQEAIASIVMKDNDVIISDKPALEYYCNSKTGFKVLDVEFKKQNFGYAFYENDDLKDKINYALLKAQE